MIVQVFSCAFGAPSCARGDKGRVRGAISDAPSPFSTHPLRRESRGRGKEKRGWFPFILGLLLAPFSSLFGEEILTLKKALALGEERSEVLLRSNEDIVQAELLRKQLLALSLPSLQIRSQIQWQDQSHLNIVPLARPLVTSPLYSVSLQLLENPLTFYKEYHAITSQDLLRNLRIYGKEAAKLSLSRDILRTYYTVLNLELNLALTDEILKVMEERIQELRSRARLGKNRPVEVIVQENQRLQLLAQREETFRALAAARNLLGFLIGTQGFSGRVTREELPLPEQIPPLEEYLKRLEERPELVAQRLQAELARKNIELARSGYFPSLGASANYYLLRNGFSKDIRWDIAAFLQVPLFSWGGVQDQLYIAESQARQAELDYARMRRSLEQDLRTTYDNLRYARENQRNYEKAWKGAEEAYKLMNKDFSRGMALNLEVLDTLHQLLNARLAYSLNRLTLEAYYLELRLLNGEVIP